MAPPRVASKKKESVASSTDDEDAGEATNGEENGDIGKSKFQDLRHAAVWPTFAFSAIILLVALWLLLGHYSSWHSKESKLKPGDERSHYYRRYLRRMQASSLLAVIAIALVGALYIGNPRALIVYWGVVCCLLVWVLVLATLDWRDSRTVLQAHLKKQDAHREQLEEEIASYRRDRLKQSRRKDG